MHWMSRSGGMALARTHARLVWLTVISAFVLSACGSERLPSDYEAAQAALTTASCENGILKEEHTVLRYIGASVTSRICNPVAGGVPAMVSRDDAAGKQVDLNQLREADNAAFHSWHAGIQPDFRASMEKAEDEAHEVYVWFYVDQADAPEKEWLVGEPLAAAAASASAESRIRTGALQLAGKLSAEGVGVVSDLLAPVEYGIPVIRARAKLAVLDTVGTWPEVWRIDRVPSEAEHTLLADTFYYTTVESWPDYFGYDGTGVTVATYEGKFPDSWANLPGAPSGSCIDEYGVGRKCHCPGAQNRGDHSRGAMGVVRRSTGILGMANDATTIMANYGDCATNGPDVYASALNWATTNGATVISHSACTGTGSDPNAHDIFFDYKASVSPYPLVAAAAGNDSGKNVCNKLRNGLVVGGTLEYNGSSNRSLAYADPDKSYLNGTNGASGYEVPHVSAISAHVSSAVTDQRRRDARRVESCVGLSRGSS
ncbi:MAG: hypothetical protein IPI67_00060 [Myxococcales bacterium]|nr:hypothetical protein [Myxococcales bacterium]